MPQPRDQTALDIRVTGIVQGVGFRPFVYRLAHETGVAGWVLNGVDGVHVHAEGTESQLEAFVRGISDRAPAAARVERLRMDEVPVEGFEDFAIRFSDDDRSAAATLVSPDLATCDECVRELFDPRDRRYRYPFINCTNCGPRFTIIEKLPYDRPHTSMGKFPMCPDCAREYGDPSNRRFHAQPDACWECGPHISWYAPAGAEAPGGSDAPSGTPRSAVPSGRLVEPSLRSCASLRRSSTEFTYAVPKVPSGASEPPGASAPVWGSTREESDAILAQAVELLRGGGIIAIKGLGGFHLACDASNPAAIAELRRRKHREGKAFAVMVRTVEDARAVCLVSDDEAALLRSPARPIVLLRKRPDAVLAPGLADKLPELGIMLPATPLQHLLLHDYRGMLVMTSGNVHDEPIQTDDGEAFSALAGIADAFIGNDRPIRSRYDDSVVRVLDFGAGVTATQVIRRARGFAPLPVATAAVPADAPTVFATGPEQKATFCLTRPGEAFVSQHIGDMENAATSDAWLEAKRTYEALLRLTPSLVACDKHPEYLTSKWAADQELPVIAVQHHHAHIASAMAENNLEGPVCGLAFDGTGSGEDGAVWGGEVLLADLASFERFANFAYFPLPGGAAAIKHPLRCAYGALWAFDLLDHPGAARVREALKEQAETLDAMIERGINCPQTSSVGRLFDAASVLLGLCDEPTYEGEGAVLLEAAIDGEDPSAIQAPYHVDIVKNTAVEGSTAQNTAVLLVDAAPLFRALLDDIAAGVPSGVIARRFHDGIVDAIVTLARLAKALYGLRTVVLSGGVFMNRYLCEHAVPALAEAGFTVALPRELPPNDACISFGQAVVALRASK